MLVFACGALSACGSDGTGGADAGAASGKVAAGSAQSGGDNGVAGDAAGGAGDSGAAGAGDSAAASDADGSSSSESAANGNKASKGNAQDGQASGSKGKAASSKSSSSKKDASGKNSSKKNSSKTDGASVSKNSENSISVLVDIDGSAAGVGMIASKTVCLKRGASVYDALCMVVTPSGSATYVSGIAGLNEKDHGPMSGWTYRVNGVLVMKAANACKLSNGDHVVWTYVNVTK